MDLLGLIVLIVLLGIIWWAITTYVPMPPAGKQVLTIAFVLVVVLALLSFLGFTQYLHWRPR